MFPQSRQLIIMKKVNVDCKLASLCHMWTWERLTCFIDSADMVKAYHKYDEIFFFSFYTHLSVLLILSFRLTSIMKESEIIKKKYE